MASLAALSAGGLESRLAEMDLWAGVVRHIGRTDLYWALDRLARLGALAEEGVLDGLAPRDRFWADMFLIQEGIVRPFVEGRLPE